MLCLLLRVECVSSHSRWNVYPANKNIVNLLGNLGVNLFFRVYVVSENQHFIPHVQSMTDLTTFLIHHITGRYMAKEGNSTLVRIPALCFLFFFSPPQSTFQFTWFQHSCAKWIWKLAEQWHRALGTRRCQPLRDQRTPETSHLSRPHRGLRLLWSFPTPRRSLAGSTSSQGVSEDRGEDEN